MPPSSFKDYVEQVRSASDIVELVGEIVQLRRAGRKYVGLCPFHQEKAPSFQVDPDRGVFHCFGCKAGGSVFDFVMQLHGLEFSEAAHMLGDRLGIQRPQWRDGGGGKREEDRRRKVFGALDAAQEFFHKTLFGPGGREALAYLERRGMSEDVARRFGLGLAPDGWRGLLTDLTSRGFDVDCLVEAGLVSRSEESRGVYDRFRNRVTFAIRDTAGRIVSFGGRALDDNSAKYLNGPETAVFDKRRTLFRLHESSREIRDQGQAVVVEGYFDALSLASLGIPGVVAACGTALGADHIRLLRRWCRRVVLFLDGDRAGREAARRSLNVFLSQGLGVRVALAPAGMDPDDLARSRGREAVEDCLERSLEFPEFLASEAADLYDLTSVDGRVAASGWCLEHLVLLPSPLARADAAGRVADGLKIEDDVMRAELSQAARARRRRVALGGASSASPQHVVAALRPAESCLLRFALAALTGQGVRAETALSLIGDVPVEVLSPTARTILESCRGRLAEGSVIGVDRWCDDLGEIERRQVRELCFLDETLPGQDEAESAVAALRVSLLRGRLTEIQRRIAQTQDQGEQERLLCEKLSLAREIHMIGASESGTPGEVLAGGE